ncbi:hypothetical protein [Streptomyces malaysiensis]|uniref:hypothetical protein n=1 Tax=Streptomyces malaysiensis TaxID=92644 RepID=UPI004047CE18
MPSRRAPAGAGRRNGGRHIGDAEVDVPARPDPGVGGLLDDAAVDHGQRGAAARTERERADAYDAAPLMDPCRGQVSGAR